MAVATYSEAFREYAYNCGNEDGRETQAWILTPWDTWEPNPHYHGPSARHPEDYDDPRDWIEQQDEMEANGGPVLIAYTDDIPW